MRILLVEDDPIVELMLKSESFNVYTTDSGEEGVDLAKLYDYDLIVLSDVRDMTGIDVVRSIRNAKVKTPAIVLSGSSQVDVITHALDSGADDYMTKPFHKDELVARIHAVVRRSRGYAASKIIIGDVTVDIDSKTVSAKGKPVYFTSKEYQLVELFALRANTTVSREMMLNHLYGGRDEPEMKIIDVFMCKVRRKFTEAGLPNLIETVWGRGYVLRNPDAEVVTLAPAMTNPVGRSALADTIGGHARRAGAV